MRARRAVRALFGLLLAAFVARYLRDLDWRTLAATRIAWGPFALALAAGTAQRFLLPAVWALILRDLGARVVRYRELNLVYARSWLGRYLPGKVAMIAARVWYAETLGVPRPLLAVSTALETGVQVLVPTAVGLLGVATLAGALDTLGAWEAPALALLALVTIALAPPVLNALLRIAYRFLDRNGPRDAPRLKTSTIGRAVLGTLVVVAGQGVYVNLVASAVDGRASEHPLFVLGAYSLAGTFGMVSLLAPGGLGVREAALIPLLALVVPKEAAVATVLLVRLADLIVDGLFFSVTAWHASRGAGGPGAGSAETRRPGTPGSDGAAEDSGPTP